MRKRIFTDLMTGKITPLICLKDELLEREGTKKKRRSVNIKVGQRRAVEGRGRNV